MMLSPHVFVEHNAPLAMRERWQSQHLSSVLSLQQYWQRADAAQQELLREDMRWLMQHVAPERSHQAWIKLATTLLRLCSPCLDQLKSSEACAYFAKAADHVFWCHKANSLEQHPAHFAGYVYQFTVRCAQTVSNREVLKALDGVILDWLAITD